MSFSSNFLAPPTSKSVSSVAWKAKKNCCRNRPPRPCDLAACEISIWVHLKNKVYVTAQRHIKASKMKLVSLLEKRAMQKSNKCARDGHLWDMVFSILTAYLIFYYEIIIRLFTLKNHLSQH